MAIRSILVETHQAMKRSNFFLTALCFCLYFSSFTSVNAQRDSLYIINGKTLEQDLYKDYKGSAYFFEDFKKVDVMSVGGVLIENITANYNGFKGEFEVIHEDKYTNLPNKLYPDVWIYLDENDKLFESYPAEFRFANAVHEKLKNKYVIVLFEQDNVKLIEQFYITENVNKVETPGKTVETKSFYRKSIYNLIVGDELIELKATKKGLIKALGSEREIEKLLKQSKNKLKTSLDLVSAVSKLHEIGFFL